MCCNRCRAMDLPQVRTHLGDRDQDVFTCLQKVGPDMHRNDRRAMEWPQQDGAHLGRRGPYSED